MEELYAVQLPWIAYLQLAHLFQKSPMPATASVSLTIFERLMKSESLPKRGLISIIYKYFLGLRNRPPFVFQKAWEGDLQMQITDDMWRSAHHLATFYSRSTNTQMAAYKIYYRWHLTPSKLHKIY